MAMQTPMTSPAPTCPQNHALIGPVKSQNLPFSSRAATCAEGHLYMPETTPVVRPISHPWPLETRMRDCRLKCTCLEQEDLKAEVPD